MRLKLAVCVMLLAGASGVAWAQGRPGMAQADANGDGAISRAEMTAARAAIFARLDANHDGYVTEQEQRQARRQRAEERRRQVDADGDGRLSRAEFAAQPMRGFDRFDANHNDVLEPSELQAMRGARPRSGG